MGIEQISQDKPPELGPDLVQILEGSTFVGSDGSGDIPEGADFADLFEVKDGNFAKRGTFTRRHGDAEHALLSFEYTSGPFGVATRVHSTAEARVEGDDLVFDLLLRPREPWKTSIQVAVSVEQELLDPAHEDFRISERQTRRGVSKMD